MAKIFKANDAAPRMLADYERATLEEPRYEDPAAYTEELPAVPDEEEILTRETILAEARAEAERKVQEAYQAGLERGIGAGRKQFSESIGRSAEALDLAAEAIREANDAFLASLEPEVVKLVRQIAEALIHREVQTDPELIHRTVRKALSAILDRERLVVRVNPVDLEALRSNKVALLDEFDGVEVLDVEADPSIAPGGCVVDSELMHVDARIKTQLKRVLAALADPSAEIGAGEA